jgi:hypothetical protein
MVTSYYFVDKETNRMFALNVSDTGSDLFRFQSTCLTVRDSKKQCKKWAKDLDSYSLIHLKGVYVGDITKHPKLMAELLRIKCSSRSRS